MADSVNMLIYPVQIRENDYGNMRTVANCPAFMLNVPKKKTFDAWSWCELARYIDRESRKHLQTRHSAHERYQDGIHHLDVFLCTTGICQIETYLCSITLYSTEGNYAMTDMSLWLKKGASPHEINNYTASSERSKTH